MNQSNQAQILIVDDARDIREPLGQYLRKQGYRTKLAADAAEARSILVRSHISLVVLDIMMPGEDGLSLCRYLAENDGPPIILLTALAQETDRIIGLELGADDYLVKPFNPRELLARIRSVLRRVPDTRKELALSSRRFGEWVHDPVHRILTNGDGQSRDLTSGESELLGIFLDNPHSVMSRADLLDLTKRREEKAYDRAIDNTVSRLRRKLEKDPKKPEILLTQWGGGYVLACDVEMIGQET